jgi:hypothetical protein
MGSLNRSVYSQPPASILEKRRSPRYAFSSSAEAIDTQASTRIFGRLSDIARNGCYIDTISPFAKNANVALTVTKDHQSFKTEAKVVYSMAGMGMGLSFTATESEHIQLLEAWLDELGGTKTGAKDNMPNLLIQPDAAKRTDQELRNTLTELIALLNSKNILNDAEGMALLRKLSK